MELRASASESDALKVRPQSKVYAVCVVEAERKPISTGTHPKACGSLEVQMGKKKEEIPLELFNNLITCHLNHV